MYSDDSPTHTRTNARTFTSTLTHSLSQSVIQSNWKGELVNKIKIVVLIWFSQRKSVNSFGLTSDSNTSRIGCRVFKLCVVFSRRVSHFISKREQRGCAYWARTAFDLNGYLKFDQYLAVSCLCLSVCVWVRSAHEWAWNSISFNCSKAEFNRFVASFLNNLNVYWCIRVGLRAFACLCACVKCFIALSKKFDFISLLINWRKKIWNFNAFGFQLKFEQSGREQKNLNLCAFACESVSFRKV